MEKHLIIIVYCVAINPLRHYVQMISQRVEGEGLEPVLDPNACVPF